LRRQCTVVIGTGDEIPQPPAMTPIEVIYAHTFKTMSAEVTDSLVRNPPPSRGQIEEVSGTPPPPKKRWQTHRVAGRIHVRAEPSPLYPIQVSGCRGNGWAIRSP
jgi:hypothetical protein